MKTPISSQHPYYCHHTLCFHVAGTWSETSPVPVCNAMYHSIHSGDVGRLCHEENDKQTKGKGEKTGKVKRQKR